ncbi:hypothetical protein TNCV_2385221 [Trichonephila clavipes]|nr:hypothetical protein TNCV_2385221 [Trichonephila clavipes]
MKNCRLRCEARLDSLYLQQFHIREEDPSFIPSAQRPEEMLPLSNGRDLWRYLLSLALCFVSVETAAFSLPSMS